MLSIKGISNIYLKVTAEKLLLDILKTLQSIKICYQVSFGGAPTCSDNIEF